MTSLGLVGEDVPVSVTTKEPVLVLVEQITTMSPTAETREMESLGAAVGTDNFVVETPQEEIHAVLPAKEGGIDHGNARRPRTSSSPHLRRSTSLGSLRQDREGNKVSSRRKEIGLRLPSFRGLGISSSDPKYLIRNEHAENQTSRSGTHPQTQRPGLRPRPFSIYHHASDPHFGSAPLLTPPEDTSSIKWNNAVLHTSSPSGSWCPQHGRHFGRMNGITSVSMADSSAGGSSGFPGQQEQTVPRGNMSDPRGQRVTDDASNSGSWLAQAIEETVSSVSRSPTHNSTINVVAHVLPLPAEDTSPHHAVFEAAIRAIQERHNPANQPYITITHAVPQKFDLNSLPTSPPATPNIVREGGDYFNQYTFAHAAVVPAYHAATRGLGASTNASPNQIVPPRSVQVALLERYIPPSSIEEYNDLFSIYGRSALVDRLSELSVDSGTLLFICPTKTGATTFSHSYLSPILTPILLQIVNLNRLVWNLAEDIGRMAVIPIMNEFDIMKTKVTTLCNNMSERPSTGTRSRFELVYSSIGDVPLDQATWREWYIEQEKGRIREVLKSYWKQGRRLPGDSEVTDATIARAIIDGLHKGVRDVRSTSGEGVEVGVFVIKRSSA